jgi:hypothetical protein
LAALCAKRDPLDAIDQWCLVELTSTLKNSYRSARIANCERKLCRQSQCAWHLSPQLGGVDRGPADDARHRHIPVGLTTVHGTRRLLRILYRTSHVGCVFEKFFRDTIHGGWVPSV